MTNPTPDPRVYFAAERTLLAWVRSGLTVMVMGFVVARFGLFLILLTASANVHTSQHSSHWLSSMLGISLVIVGATITLGAQYNHSRYIKTLPSQDVPLLAITWLAPFLTLSVGAVGLLLAIYLAVV